MKYIVPIIVSFAYVAVQALPIPDDRGTGVTDILDEGNGLFGQIKYDFGELLGSLSDQLGAKSKRGLLDEVLTTKPDDAGLLTGSLSAADVKAVLDSAGVEADDGRVDDLLEELKGGNIDELVDEAFNTLLARSLDKETRDARDNLNAEAGIQTDLNKRTITVSTGGLVAGLGYPIDTTGEAVNNALGKIEGVVTA